MTTTLQKFYDYMNAKKYKSNTEYMSDKRQLNQLLKDYNDNSNTFTVDNEYYESSRTYSNNGERLDNLKAINRIKNQS